jgi:hypothetical protein
MLSFFLATAASAILIGVLLLITRQRLARQFTDIERRQIEIERAIAVIKLGIERSTTDAQLKRLHLGLVRIQENMAQRYGELALSASRRRLGELQSEALRQWSQMLGAELEAGQIEDLARIVERAEILEPKGMEIGTPDLFARVIALLSQRDRKVSIGMMGTSSGWSASFVRRLVSDFFDQAEVSQVPDDLAGMKPLNVLIFDEAVPLDKLEPVLRLVKDGGLLLMHAAADGDVPDFAAFELVAAEWNTRVYRRPAP